MATEKNLLKKQEELDVIKWLESEMRGQDRCGDYEYCVMCHIDDSQPCARAFERFRASQGESKKPASATAATKKPAAKKSTAKKK